MNKEKIIGIVLSKMKKYLKKKLLFCKRNQDKRQHKKVGNKKTMLEYLNNYRLDK